MFRGGSMTIEVVSAEALPLCLDDKATDNASDSQLHAFVEIKVITKTIFATIFFMIIIQGGRQKSGSNRSIEKY